MIANLVHLQTNQFLLQSLCIKEWFEKKGEFCFLLAPKHFEDSLTKIGLVDFTDVIFENDFNEFIRDSNYSEINIVIHHYDTQLNSYPMILNSIANNLCQLRVSYFADGYVNAFLNLPLALEKKIEFPNIVPKYAFSFDYTMNYFKERMTDVEHVQIDSELLIPVFEKWNFYPHLKSGIESLQKRISKNDLCLALIMRPWGSESFHGGNYSLLNGAHSLYEIVVKMIEDIKYDVGEDFVILYRRDNRDKQLMDEFEVLIHENKNLWNNFIDINEMIPSFLTMDSFFYFFTEKVSKKLMTTVFDSTTSLPLIKLQKGLRHYLGASHNITNRLQKNPEMTKKYSNKVNMSRKYIASLSNAGEYEEQEVVDGFYCIKKLTEE